MKLLLLFLALPLCAADYCILQDTNLAPALGKAVYWRGFIEPQIYTVVSTNWSTAIETESTNGTRTLHMVAVLITNRTVHFTFEGKRYVQTVSVDSGPIVAERKVEIPVPPTPVALPLRKAR